MNELLKNFEPKKLWLLRIYVKFLEGISSLILVFYCGASIYLMFKESNSFINIIMGATGIYIVIIAVTILILAQVINLFIGIHDNVDDIRKKQLDPNFKYSEADEKLKLRNDQINSIYIICLIILSIIFIFINFSVTKEKSINNNVSTNTLETEANNEQREANLLNFEQLYPVLKSSLLKNVCEPYKKLEENKDELTAYSETGMFLSSWSWDRKKIQLKDIDNDGIIDYIIELFNEGGGCGGQVGQSERWTMFGSKPNIFICTHIIPYRSESGNWEKLPN